MVPLEEKLIVRPAFISHHKAMLLGNSNAREAVVHSILFLFPHTLVQSKVGDLWNSSKQGKDD